MVESREHVLAPIILFAYNRPVHVRRTVESLQANALASQSNIIAFCDGPRSTADEPLVGAVRKYLKTVAGFKSINVIEREKNHGLANSVINGISEVLATHDRAIIVEDDLLLSPVFLKYMNNALERYVTIDRVMHIAAYMYPIDSSNLPETFFFRAASCWGWGTWRRAWRGFEPNVHALIEKFDTNMRLRFNINGTYGFWDTLLMQEQGRIDSWAIRWYASVFLNDGLCLHPSISMVRNHGTDGSGTHSIPTTMYDGMIRDSEIKTYQADLVEDEEALKRITRFLSHARPSLIQRIVNRFAGLFPRAI
jgi:hypothetical protein